MWESMQGSSDKTPATEQPSERISNNTTENTQFDDADTDYVPMGFGRGRGRGDMMGRGGGRGGRGAGRGRGPERDAKGKDWDCPSCTNTNWSWRSNCNKCGTAKPASALVSLPEQFC